MSIVKKGGLAVLLFVIVAALVTGCMPGRGASANVGWTVVAADADTVYTALPDGKVAVSYTHLDVYKRQEEVGERIATRR